MEKFNWIKKHFSAKDQNSRNSISGMVPNIFEEYYLIHWKVGIVDKFPFDEYPEQNETFNKQIKGLRLRKNLDFFSILTRTNYLGKSH